MAKDHEVTVEPRTTLLEALRFQLDLNRRQARQSWTGSSGASTVLVDGRAGHGVHDPALSAVGKKGPNGREPGGEMLFPARVCRARRSAMRLLHSRIRRRGTSIPQPEPQRDGETKSATGLNGNICRCGTYANVLQAALAGGERRRKWLM